MTRSLRLAAVALGGAVALTCAVPTAPAQAVPDADTPVATVQLSLTVPRAAASARPRSTAPAPPPRSGASVCGPRQHPGQRRRVRPQGQEERRHVDTGAPCTPTEIQAVNTWLYWSCGSTGPAGVYDRATGRAITVPAGQGRLADGYLIRENRTTHELLLTDFHTGTATTRTVAVLPTADRNTGGSTGSWAVDRFGGNVAHLTQQRQVAIVTAGVPTSPLAQMEAQTDPQVGGPSVSNPWRPVWQLNKPSAWTLTLSNTAGTVVRIQTGASTAAAVRASWNAQNDSGTYVPRGTYTWKLTAEPRDGQGPALTLTGTTTVN
ncbi:FlgD immunoglobulin-like domain containing protein [Streptomyces sp. R41]|uniref:FlgD immunoglobulin-like domain containing protein n=1 Tax=Streptomyces sp. R41 TaxID=3238632 RepID=A0AB39RQ00_9ACTN